MPNDRIMVDNVACVHGMGYPPSGKMDGVPSDTISEVKKNTNYKSSKISKIMQYFLVLWYIKYKI